MNYRTLLLAFPALLGAPSLPAQTAHLGPESPTARVAVLTAALYNDQANLREASDSAQSTIATTVLRERLAQDLGNQIIAYGVVDSLADSPEAVATAGAVACHVKVACAILVGKRSGAGWVVMTKVSKTSNLIWLLSAQLIRVSTGDIVLDDSTELKGDPGPMVRIGVRSFADRVSRTVKAGGYVNNFPSGEPGQ
jgi:hypothetical protein